MGTKKLRKMIIGVVGFMVSVITGALLGFAIQYSTIGFYHSGLPSGIAYYGPLITQVNAGYTNNGYYADTTASNFYTAVANNHAVYVHCHGSAGRINLSASTAYVTGNSILSSLSSSSAKLVYLSACNSASTSTTYGNLCSALCTKGVSAAVGFTGIITASTAINGIHYFNQNVVSYICNNTILYNAIAQAKADTYNLYGSYYGSDTCTFYGNGGLTL